MKKYGVVFVMIGAAASFGASAACREPIYIGRPEADAVTKRNHEKCLEREGTPSKRQSGGDKIDDALEEMRDIERRSRVQ